MSPIDEQARPQPVAGRPPTLLLRLGYWHLRRRRSTTARRRWVTGTVVAALAVAATTGTALAFWTTGGSGTGLARAATVTNLSIVATASPAPSHPLYPTATGDAVLTITNPNGFPVTLTAVILPTVTTYAAGYADSGLTSALPGCTSSGPTASQVAWSFAATSGAHALATPLTVAGNGTLTVTLTGDAAMGATAPSACEGAFFSLPALTGVTATSAASTTMPTPSPATDLWSS